MGQSSTPTFHLTFKSHGKHYCRCACMWSK